MLFELRKRTGVDGVQDYNIDHRIGAVYTMECQKEKEDLMQRVPFDPGSALSKGDDEDCGEKEVCGNGHRRTGRDQPLAEFVRHFRNQCLAIKCGYSQSLV